MEYKSWRAVWAKLKMAINKYIMSNIVFYVNITFLLYGSRLFMTREMPKS